MKFCEKQRTERFPLFYLINQLINDKIKTVLMLNIDFLNMENNTIIISLGGSLIVTKNGIDCRYLKQFRSMILDQLKQGRKFFLITGGGITARDYIGAADKIVKVTDDDRDWLGIHSTRLNAHLVRTIFRNEAHPEIIKNPTIRMQTKKKITIAGGWKPGWSTDYVAAIIAEKYGVKTVINLSNIDYAYDKDPAKFKDAQRLENVSWKNFRKIVGSKWSPGLNAPFDPIASRKAERLGLEVVIMNGKNLANLKNYLAGKKFNGTVIN